MCDVNGVASPKFLGGKYFYLKRATVFCLGHHLTKLKMTRYARNFFFNFLVTAIGGKPKPKLCFLQGRLR